MTVFRDSETPISHPWSCMMARTEIITIATQSREMRACIMFPVAINKTMNAKIPAIVIPWKAELTNAFSEGIHAQNYPAVCSRDFIDAGAFLLYSATRFSHLR